MSLVSKNVGVGRGLPRSILTVVLAMLSLVAASFVSADARGDQVAAQYFANPKPADSRAEAVMTLIDRSGNRKIRELTIETKDGADGASSFMEFHQPADVAGTKFLVTPGAGGASEQRLYLPALHKTRKIASADKSGSFVNSDFSYYDLEDRKLGDNTYQFLADGQKLPGKAYEGMTFTKIEVKAKDNSPYAKSWFWINDADHHAYRIDAFDARGGALLKSIWFVKFDVQKGVQVPVQTMVVNYAQGTKTLLQLNNLVVNGGLGADVFTVQNLER